MGWRWGMAGRQRRVAGGQTSLARNDREARPTGMMINGTARAGRPTGRHAREAFRHTAPNPSASPEMRCTGRVVAARVSPILLRAGGRGDTGCSANRRLAGWQHTKRAGGHPECRFGRRRRHRDSSRSWSSAQQSPRSSSARQTGRQAGAAPPHRSSAYVPARASCSACCCGSGGRLPAFFTLSL